MSIVQTATTTPDQSRQELGTEYFLGTMSMWMSFGSVKGDLLAKHGISGPQMKILYFIKLNGRTTTSALAQDMNISSAAVTQLIDKLILQGFLKRIENKEDRRVTFLDYTAKGAKKFAKFQIDHLQVLNHFLNKLSEQELKQLIALQRIMLSE